MSVSEELLRVALSSPLERTDFPSLRKRYEGKVRDTYEAPDGSLWMVVTDRISAFDRVLGTIPFKGQVLNQLSAWWFEKTRAECDNHAIKLLDPNVLACVACTPLPVEIVVRGYLTGSTSTSVWEHYQRGERVFCGHTLPDGLQKHDPLPELLVTPTTKAGKGGHDVSMAGEALIAAGLLTAEEYATISSLALHLFREGARVCAERGLLLVDTKYEFGRTPDGRILLIDEMHTPDSSRFWKADTYPTRRRQGEDPECLDKDFVRSHYTRLGYRGEGVAPPLPDTLRVAAAFRYIAAYEQLTGLEFVPNLEEPHRRIEVQLTQQHKGEIS